MFMSQMDEEDVIGQEKRKCDNVICQETRKCDNVIGQETRKCDNVICREKINVVVVTSESMHKSPIITSKSYKRRKCFQMEQLAHIEKSLRYDYESILNLYTM